ncbi:TPA: type II toxin-antitoxin system HicB family antitoxin [Staphylococcus aureus]|uniref:type II toxin-antitoxin system HicB family antitoxin n=1 Tax=Mammaliicoccus sciuri TaxID=1296 RepID=UPI0029787391|nr:type II toxin-antitoxin system HicB family antitoxin [Mammaliicoccus sciuri]MDW4480967.1 type II toxin-antitoxin system HicB family antitoxin [Staphylococcus saprophyticus]MEB6288265.1 type II toxin-antitoxin system HicB family antitoxin [Mammaliicoccus sciuri]
MKDIKYYMNLKYNLDVSVEVDFDDSEYYIAKYKELDGLIGTGDTEFDAINELKEIKEEWFEWNLELGREIPEPIREVVPTNIKLTYRIPTSLNFLVEEYAKKEGVTKNTALTLLIQSGLYNNIFYERETLYTKIADFLSKNMFIPIERKKENVNLLSKTHSNNSESERYISPTSVKELSFIK